MPKDLAKQVKDTLNRKSITPEQELQDALEEMARDIALIEPDPKDWGGWVIFFLDQMEAEAKKRWKQIDFDEMIKSLREDLNPKGHD